MTPHVASGSRQRSVVSAAALTVSSAAHRHPRSVPVAKRLVFLLLAAYLIVGPASVSGAVTTENSLAYLKWVRVGTLGLCLLTSLQWFVIPRPREAGFWLLLFAVVFWAAGAWSDNPVWALAYKGLFLGSIVAGACVAGTIGSQRDLSVLCRMVTVSALIGLALVAASISMAGPDEDVFVHGRLSVADLNPNLLAQTAGILVLLTLFHAVTEHRVLWRYMAFTSLAALTVLVILCGSRGAMLMATIGVVAIAPIIPHSSRPRFAVLLAVLLATVVYAAVMSDASGDAESDLFLYDLKGEKPASGFRYRLWDDGLKDTRSGVWGEAFERFLSRPLLGHGWLSRGSRWATVQSSYLQVLVEAGIVGGLVLTIFLWKAFHQLRQSLSAARRSRDALAPFTYVMVAVSGALLVHAAFESSAFVGSTPNSFLLGLAIFHTDLRLANARRTRTRGIGSSTTCPRSVKTTFKSPSMQRGRTEEEAGTLMVGPDRAK